MKVLVASIMTSPYLDIRILTRITVGDTATRTMLQQAHPAKDPYPWIWMQPTCNPEMQMQMQIAETELGVRVSPASEPCTTSLHYAGPYAVERYTYT